MRAVIAGAVLSVLLLAAPAAHAQSPTVAATAPAPNAGAVLPLPAAAAAIGAFMNGQPAPGAQQVVPVPTGNGFSVLVVEPPGGQDHPSYVTYRPATNWFEAENFTSFASSPAPPRGR